MKKLLLITGDIAAGKTTFSKILSERYCTAAFQKDTIKEILGDYIGFHNREENKVLSNATIGIMCHIPYERRKQASCPFIHNSGCKRGFY